MSANTSPFLTISPICLCHPAITPSVMVSLNLGIKTTSSIDEKSAVGVVIVVGADAGVVRATAASTGAGSFAAPVF